MTDYRTHLAPAEYTYEDARDFHRKTNGVFA